MGQHGCCWAAEPSRSAVSNRPRHHMNLHIEDSMMSQQLSEVSTSYPLLFFPSMHLDTECRTFLFEFALVFSRAGFIMKGWAICIMRKFRRLG